MLDVFTVTFIKTEEQNSCNFKTDNFSQFKKRTYIFGYAYFSALSVRVDLTKPDSGIAVDGIKEGFTDLRYSPSKSTVQLQWDNFYDPESGIREYDVQVARKR